MLRADDIAIAYGPRVLMKHVSFEVARGTSFAILGGSGCGKSSLLRVLIGLQAPQQGSVTLDEVRESNDGRPVFGVMFQSGALFNSMSLFDNVALPLETWTSLDRDDVAEVVRSKLALVGLEAQEALLPSRLSGGQKKRAGIARALALDPPLLFLDEPSAGLDPISAAELDDLLVQLRRDLETTLVFVSHDLRSVTKVATDCILLDAEAKGVIAHGSPAALQRSDDARVRRFFARDFAHDSKGAG